MRRKYGGAIALLVAVALVLTGCVETHSGVPTAEDWSTPATRLWSSDDVLLSETRVWDGVALAYVKDAAGATESLVARDAETGERLWGRTSFAGNNAPGLEHRVALANIDGQKRVAMLAPESRSPDSWTGRLAVLDIRSGDGVAPGLMKLSLWSTRPQECGESFCVTGQVVQGEPRSYFSRDHANLRFATADGGTLLPSTGEDASFIAGGRYLGKYISQNESPDGVEMLNYGQNGATVWSRPYADVFGEGTSSAGGWVWRDADLEAPLLGIGYAYEEWDSEVASDRTKTLADARMVSLDRATGETLWQVDGVRPCIPTGWGLPVDNGVAVVCRVTAGVYSWHWDGSKASNQSFADLEHSLVGIDTSSGDIKWEIDLGNEDANFSSATDGGTPFATGGNPVIVRAGKAALVDAKTGRVSSLPDNAGLLCMVEQDRVVLNSAWDEEGGSYSLADKMALCSPEGKVLKDGVVSIGTLKAAGYDLSQTSVINLTTGPTAFAPTELSKEREEHVPKTADPEPPE